MRNYNAIDMKGRLYDYALQIINTVKGEAISGTITLEVDAAGQTVSIRQFAYPTYSSGKPNRTYDILRAMMDGEFDTVVKNSESVTWLSATGSIDVSYFKSRNDNELARAQQLRGAFINQNTDKKYNNRWKLDFLITRIQEVEADEEKNLPRFVRVSGYLIDDYNKRLMEVQFQARTDAAMDYFLSLDASEDMPWFVSTWGSQAKVITKRITKNAFGEDTEDEFLNTQWILTGCSPDPYDWDDERTITAQTYADFKEAMEHFKEEQLNKEDAAAKAEKDELAF